MKIGIICPSEIAIRRFMPALKKCKDLEFVGVAVYTKNERFRENEITEEEFQDKLLAEKEKARAFTSQYGGKIFDGYNQIVKSQEIDAIYIPLPPALHFKWSKIALENGKHVLVEKPATLSSADTYELVKIADNKGLAFHENYMFSFHKQLDDIESIIKRGEIGDVRLYRISFGFPLRDANDFRYNKSLGGGALIDAGGYTIRYATKLLGDTTRICYAQSNYIKQFGVDMYGSAALSNEEGIVAQVSFGMDNNYKCELEVWGSKGTLSTGRVLTAPPGYIPKAIIRKGNESEEIELSEDDAFYNSINHFLDCTRINKVRKERYDIILNQANLIDEFMRQAGW